ncbi:MAG TPA: flagellar hook-associated protein FlgL [Symbiobacteriaceae bacterium]|nr:flagellar hook-associated protein FlgL [Symbiobacteriaceae bacterium]
MRVTQQMMSSSMLTNLNQLRSRQATLSDQISSGDRITRVSEDPTSGAEVMRIQNRAESVKQWKANLGDAKSWIYATEAKLGDLTNILAQAKELALQAFNGSQSDESRKSLAPAAEQLLQDALAALNEREPTGALFGGYVTDQNPFALTFDPATNAPVVRYSGDGNGMQRDVGPSVTLTANLPGTRLATIGAGGVADPDNMISTLWSLSQALKAGKTDSAYTPPAPPPPAPAPAPVTVHTADQILSNLESARQNVIALRSEMGARQIRVESLEHRLQSTEVQLDAALQQAQGVDMAKALVELNSAETTYRAALQVGGRVFPQSLADFLR